MTEGANIVFYRIDKGHAQAEPDVPQDVDIAFWQPARHGRPTGLFASRTNRVWWLLDRLGIFARRDFTVVAVYRDSALLHRLIITPKWYRFPDMSPRDLQMGMLWTAPEARGQGLARAAIAAAHRRFAGQFDRMWYLVEEDNTASRRLIERLGYREIGRGWRTAPLGLSPIGRFRMAAES